jgi:hypothetical protein
MGKKDSTRLHNPIDVDKLSRPRTRWFDKGKRERCTKRNESCGNGLSRRWPERKIKLWLHLRAESKVCLAYAALACTRWTEPEWVEWLSRRGRRAFPDELQCPFDVLFAIPVP